MKVISFRRGQNLIELALLIGLVGLVVIGMEVYIKRGVQGKVKDLTDYIIFDWQSADRPDEVSAGRNTTISLDSNMTTRESVGGGRSLRGEEYSNSSY